MVLKKLFRKTVELGLVALLSMPGCREYRDHYEQGGSAIYEKKSDGLQFFGGTMIPISEEEYLRFVDNNLNPKVASTDDGKFEAIGELITITKNNADIKISPLSDGKFFCRYYSRDAFLTASPDQYYVSYNNGKIIISPTRITTRENFEIVVFRLPNGILVKKCFAPGVYKFDKQGNIINPKPEELEKKFMGYKNPKISLFLEKSMYLVIPKNANWDKIVRGLRISTSEKDWGYNYTTGARIPVSEKEFIKLENLKQELEKGGVYPLPESTYGEDRSGLEKIISEAIELERKWKIEDALRIYEKIVKEYDVAIPYYNIGILNLKKGNTDKAIENLKRVFEKDPDYKILLRTHLALGNIYVQRGMIVEAEEEFKKTLGIKPDYLDALYSLGALELNEKKDYKQAIGYWKRVKEINKNYPIIKNNINSLEDLIRKLETGYPN